MFGLSSADRQLMRNLLVLVQSLTRKTDYMSTEVNALGSKIDALVDLVHQLVVKLGTPVAVSPADAATLSSDGQFFLTILKI